MVNQRQTRSMALMALALVSILSVCILLMERPQDKGGPVDLPVNGRGILAANSLHEDTSKSHRILAKDKYVLRYNLSGSLFKATGRSFETHAPVVTSVVHSFSPETEHAVAKMMVDPAHQQIFYANSPAMLWHDGELIVVMRIWLENEKYALQKKWPYNTFADNVFYTQKFDGFLKPLGPGQIMGIPTTNKFPYGDGPIEPRIFRTNETIFVSFNTGMTFPSGQTGDYTVFWDYLRNQVVMPTISGGSPMLVWGRGTAMPRDKHWCAFDDHGELYFVYNIDPLRILKCEVNGSCAFVHFEGSRSYKFGDFRDHLRGGTPFELYRYPYYIGVAHVTLFKETNTHRVYTANLVVLHVKPYRVVYVSSQLRLHQDVMTSVPIVRFVYIDDPFIFPVGIILEDPDTLYLGVHINDYSSVMVRIRGLKALMEEVITLDRIQGTEKGAPIHSIQDYVHEIAAQDTGYVFHKFVEQ